MIEARHIHASINGKTILRDISMSAPEGKVTSILGPNGAGKSTLLKCLAGFLKTDQGDILLAGTPLSHYSRKELACSRAVLTQHLDISFPMEVHEVVALGTSNRTFSTDMTPTDAIVPEALALTEMLDFGQRDYNTLSGGEKQRVQLARVLAQLWDQRDAILFLDEPTSALDLKHSFRLFEICRKLATEKNLTIITVLHDLRLARALTDHAVLLQNGKLHAAGDAKATITADVVNPLYGISNEEYELAVG